MDKDERRKPFTSKRERQQKKLNQLKKYIYLKDTYGVKVQDIKTYSLILYGKTSHNKNYNSNRNKYIRNIKSKPVKV